MLQGSTSGGQSLELISPSEQTAAYVLCLSCVEDDQAAGQLIESAFIADPRLLLWTLKLASEKGCDGTAVEVDSIEAAAAWFVANQVELLTLISVSLKEFDKRQPVTIEQFVDARRLARLLSTKYRELQPISSYRSNQPLTPEDAYLLGLVYTLWKNCPADTSSFFPAWLDNRLTNLGECIAKAAADLGDEYESATSEHVSLVDILPKLLSKQPEKSLESLQQTEASQQLFDQKLYEAKLQSLKELAYGASHEINNPLANIATRAQSLMADESNPERSRQLSVMYVQAMRAHEMIADLMMFARPPEITPQDFNLNDIILEVIEQSKESAELQGTAIEFHPSSDSLNVHADRVQLSIVLQALLRNALEALKSGGTVAVAAEIQGQTLNLTVSDTGPGVPEEIRQKVFDPFFSGREAGRGLGFGLSKCWTILKAHGGEIHLQENQPTGTIVTVELPQPTESHSLQEA